MKIDAANLAENHLLITVGMNIIFVLQKNKFTSPNTHFAASLPSVATPILLRGRALLRYILPRNNIAKCGTLAEIGLFLSDSTKYNLFINP